MAGLVPAIHAVTLGRMDEADRIIGLYERHAHAFDAGRGQSLIERPWLDRFLALVPHGGSVLDLGCGAGEPIARHLIAAGCAVTGVDSSPTMIALCQSRFPDARWIVADMRGLSLGRRFDGILAWDSFFHLRADDQRKMFAIFRDHAAPGARCCSRAARAPASRWAPSKASRSTTPASTRTSTARSSPRTASRLSRTWPRTTLRRAHRVAGKGSLVDSRRRSKGRLHCAAKRNRRTGGRR